MASVPKTNPSLNQEARRRQSEKIVKKTSDLHATHEILVRMEHSKRASEDLVYFLPELVLVVDESGRVLKGNRASEEAFQKEPQNLTGSNIARLFSDLSWQEFRKQLQKVAAGEAGLVAGFELSTDGTNICNRFYRWSVFRVGGISRRRGLLLYVVGHDITGIMMMMEKIKESHQTLEDYKRELELHLNLVRQQKNQLLEASKMTQLGEMAGGIADEIRHPVLSMQEKIAELGRTVRGGLADTQEKNELISSASEIASIVGQIASIVKCMRLLARDGSHDTFEPADLVMIVNDALVFFREKLRRSQISLSVHSTPEKILYRCRAVQIAQLMINLLNNARDAVFAASERWIRIDITESQEKVTILVTDSGPRIPDEVAEKMMQPFFTTKEAGVGAGLGLSMGQSIANEHGGDLRLDRTCKNTRFIIELPKIDPGDI